MSFWKGSRGPYTVIIPNWRKKGIKMCILLLIYRGFCFCHAFSLPPKWERVHSPFFGPNCTIFNRSFFGVMFLPVTESVRRDEGYCWWYLKSAERTKKAQMINIFKSNHKVHSLLKLRKKLVSHELPKSYSSCRLVYQLQRIIRTC